mgnify:CR=1 FL=1
MKRTFPALALMAILLMASFSLTSASNEKPIIVCTTTVLSSIVEELVGDDADVIVLVQPGICPAYYDIKPSDVYAVSKARVIFYHGFEYKMWLKDMIESSGNRDVILVKVSGNWNDLNGAKRYITTIAGNLSEIFAKDYMKKASSMISELESIGEFINEKAAELRVNEVKVVCMKWQKSFVEFIGFNVTDSYGPPERISAKRAAELEELIKREGIALVIDNLQSGTYFGAELSSKTGAIHVVLTNFPDAIPGTSSLVEMIKYNAEQLFNAVAEWRSISHAKEEISYLRGEIENLKTKLLIFQGLSLVLAICVAIELYIMRRRR